MKNIIMVAIPVIAAAIGALSALLNRIFLGTRINVFGGAPDKENLKWLKATEHTDVYMMSRDGFRLHGLCFDNNSDKWLILVHGYDSNAAGMLYYARMFREKGYSLLIPDQRGYGLSDGEYTTMGHLEKYDIIDWAKLLISRKNARSIVLFGVSMGAATVMLTASEELPEGVRAIVEDCGYTSVKEEFEHNFGNVLKLPPYPFLWVCDILSRVRHGWSILKDGNCMKAVKHSKVPILFIHGSSDTFVPFAMQKKLYDACLRDDKEIYTVKGAEHTQACGIDPDTYLDTVCRFVEKHIQ